MAKENFLGVVRSCFLQERFIMLAGKINKKNQKSQLRFYARVQNPFVCFPCSIPTHSPPRPLDTKNENTHNAESDIFDGADLQSPWIKLRRPVTPAVYPWSTRAKPARGQPTHQLVYSDVGRPLLLEFARRGRMRIRALSSASRDWNHHRNRSCPPLTCRQGIDYRRWCSPS